MRLVDILAVALAISAVIIVILVRTWYENRLKDMDNAIREHAAAGYKDGWAHGSEYFLRLNDAEVRNIRSHLKELT